MNILCIEKKIRPEKNDIFDTAESRTFWMIR